MISATALRRLLCLGDDADRARRAELSGLVRTCVDICRRHGHEVRQYMTQPLVELYGSCTVALKVS